MEVPGRKIDISTGVPCDLCLLLGKNEKAEHFCTDCNEFFCDNCCMVHKVTRYSRNHKLLDSGNMPKQKLESSENSVCSKHSEKGLKYFCEDHNTIFCSVCVILDHKNCNLLFIDEIAANFDKTPEYKSLTDSIASLTKQLQEMKEMSIKIGEDLKKSHGKFITDVKAFRKEINQILDTIEYTIIKESDALKEDHLKLAVSTSTMCNNLLAELNIASEKMREQLRYMQHRQLVMSAKETQIKVKEYQSKLVEMSQGKSMELEFVPNEILLQSLRSFTNMGDIKQNDVPFKPDDTFALQKEYVVLTQTTPLKEHAACKTLENQISDVPFEIKEIVTLQKDLNVGSSTMATHLKQHAAYETPENHIQGDLPASTQVKPAKVSEKEENVEPVEKQEEEVPEEVTPPTPSRETTPADETIQKVEKKIQDAEEVEDELEKGEIVDDQDDYTMLKYKYAEDQWSSLNPKGKKHYDREFLLQFQHESSATSKPAGLPEIPDIKLDKAKGIPHMPSNQKNKGGPEKRQINLSISKETNLYKTEDARKPTVVDKKDAALSEDNDAPFKSDDTVTFQKEYVFLTQTTPLKEHAACKAPENHIFPTYQKTSDYQGMQIPHYGYEGSKITNERRPQDMEKGVEYRKRDLTSPLIPHPSHVIPPITYAQDPPGATGQPFIQYGHPIMQPLQSVGQPPQTPAFYPQASQPGWSMDPEYFHQERR